MPEKKIRTGLVGYGHRGKHMFKLAAEAFAAVQPVSICEINTELARKAGQDFPGAQIFNDFDEMLEQISPDVLFVETPAALHAEFCSKALGKNIYVMSDVPCVDSIEQALQLWEAQQKSKAFYMIGANPNMWGFAEAAFDLKKKGLLGEPYYMEAEYIHDCRHLWDSTPWRETYESIRYCTHSLGPLLRLIEEDLEWVACFDTGSHIDRKDGRHDLMSALFRTASNVSLRMMVSLINNYPGCEHRYRIYGTKGYFERSPAYNGQGSAKTYFYSTEIYGDKALTELPVGEARPGYKGNSGHGGADYALLESFFNAVREGLPSPIGIREALRMSLPGIYAAESARQGGKLLEIKYPWSK